MTKEKPVSYGEKGRIGLIYPSSGWVMEPEFYAMAPEGIATVTTRIKLESTTAEAVQKLEAHVQEAADLLRDARVDVIALGCTSGSFICGHGYDKTIIEEIEAAVPGIPATTTATAVIRAIHAFGAKKLAVGTPYIEEINRQARAFLEAEELEVLSLEGLELVDDAVINGLSREEIKELARRADVPEADLLVLLCTSIKGVDVLEELEEEMGKPVITAIQATFWDCLRLLDVDTMPEGYGRLFTKE